MGSTTTQQPEAASSVLRLAGRPMQARVIRSAAIVARELVEQASAQAQRLRAAAEVEAAAVRESARKSGYKEGQQEALRKVLEARASERLVVARSREAMIELALEICRSVLGREPQRALLELRLQQLLAELPFASALRLAAHSADLPLVEAALDAGVCPSKITLEADDSLAHGTLRATTEHGTAEASLEHQLAAIREHLRGPPGPAVAA